MRRRFLLSIAAVDLVLLTAAGSVASWLVFGTPMPWRAPGLGASTWPMVGMLTAGFLVGTYLSARAWASSMPRPSYGRAVTIGLVTLGGSTVAIALTRVYYSRAFIGLTVMLWMAGALTYRFVRRRRPWTETMVLVTAEKGLADELRDAPHADVLAVFDPGTTGELAPLPLGATLVVDLRAVLSDRMAQYVSSCVLAGLPVRAFTQVYEEHTGRLPIVHLAEGWELSTPLAKTAPYVPVKRVIDTITVLAISPLALLIGIGIAIAVRTSSDGPVIFKQTRVGRHDRAFTLYKFRTMVVDAEKDGPAFSRPGDQRLTPVGRWLRRFRADELPQLWNVLRGDVSLVGPRPEQVAFVERFERLIPFYASRHLVRPGVTGWAQVNYGYADDQADTIEKLTYDLYYVKHMSPWLDLAVVGRSVWTVLSGFGAR